MWVSFWPPGAPNDINKLSEPGVWQTRWPRKGEDVICTARKPCPHAGAALPRRQLLMTAFGALGTHIRIGPRHPVPARWPRLGLGAVSSCDVPESPVHPAVSEPGASSFGTADVGLDTLKQPPGRVGTEKDFLELIQQALSDHARPSSIRRHILPDSIRWQGGLEPSWPRSYGVMTERRQSPCQRWLRKGRLYFTRGIGADHGGGEVQSAGAALMRHQQNQ